MQRKFDSKLSQNYLLRVLLLLVLVFFYFFYQKFYRKWCGDDNTKIHGQRCIDSINIFWATIQNSALRYCFKFFHRPAEYILNHFVMNFRGRLKSAIGQNKRCTKVCYNYKNVCRLVLLISTKKKKKHYLDTIFFN